MNILLDANTLSPVKAGIGYYTYNLITELAKLKAAQQSLAICIRTKLLNNFAGIEARVKVISIPEPVFAKYLPFESSWMSGFDLYHEPNYIPRLFTGKTVVTICDMSHKLFPQHHPRRRVLQLNLFANRMRIADHIITISQNSKQEIIDFLGIPEERISITYLGANLDFQKLTLECDMIDNLRQHYHLPERFFLYVGTIEPRKNLARLIEAYSLARNEGIDQEIKLVLTGGNGWLYKDIYARVKQLRLENEIIFTGYVSDKDLPILYNMAEVFVYPSIYEGFGLSPLEAMACGIPVIASNTSSIPEVVGDAGILVDPYRVEDIASAMFKVIESRQIQDDLSQRGLIQAQRFSWKKCAEETWQVYQQCLQGG